MFFSASLYMRNRQSGARPKDYSSSKVALWLPGVLPNVYIGTFTPAGAVRLSMNRGGMVCVSTAKSGRGSDLAVISRTISQYSSVGVPSGLKGCQQDRAKHAVR